MGHFGWPPGLKQLAQHEGYTLSQFDGVSFMRADRSLPAHRPVLYEPSIVIVCQGHKRGHIGDQIYHDDAQHYLVLPAPPPFSTETEASPKEPLLAASVQLDMATVADLGMAPDNPPVQLEGGAATR